ncbi:zeta toxin family protein [Gemmobacter sp.]|uniref:zeta toxin family protein n=1 Tax=Gemmobacter sp. TaxID=1898957 RepID=UPI002AFF67D2|nr:AAA family ATPase [Gemmobacter sp.]
MSPTVILLAGPNGAGKSTLYKTRVAPAFAGPFVNADIIQRDELGNDSPEAAYRAAEIAAKRRSDLLATGSDFVTETVFSHRSKLDFVGEARARGYSVWVLHIGVDSADLSVMRVAHRVEFGGHNVPETKIRERYDRSAPLIREAVLLAETGLVYDNSVAGKPPKLVLTFERGHLMRVRPEPPTWIRQAYAPELQA